VLVIRDGKDTFCSTVGELARALGVRQKKVSPDPFKCCLCNADVEAFGARRATDEEGWPTVAYTITLPAPPK
jgi:hypothetical protein